MGKIPRFIKLGFYYIENDKGRKVLDRDSIYEELKSQLEDLCEEHNIECEGDEE